VLRSYKRGKSEYEAAAKGGVVTQGRVVDIKECGSSGGDKKYWAIIEFNDSSGNAITIESGFGHVFWENKLGSTVEVAYNPDNPKAALIKENVIIMRSNAKSLAIVCAIIAGILAVFIVGHMFG
jgi:hypothetical protein